MMVDSKKQSTEEWYLVKNVLHEHWDPLGIRNEPKAEDEYDGYVSAALRLAQNGDVQGLKAYLTSIELDQMKTRPDASKNETVAAMIVDQLMYCYD
jgi:hypothetical protein